MFFLTQFTHSTIGAIHLLLAVVAMITGAVVILRVKGDLWHKRIGYVYVCAMLGVNATAFGIYHLWGKFGIFHALALLSLLSIVGGMAPVYKKPRKPNWKVQHLEVMSWSVVGLYAAFVSEVGVRLLPSSQFFWVVGLGSGIVCAIGSVLIKRRKKLEAKVS